ncbi:MAG TPA: hypothetical protein VN345_09155 [Blastocatellia bacterium]|nr:hypothetical protein [Blastocatellia bacterium]
MPVLDEWDMSVPLVLRAREGTLQLAQLWAQQNEHRMLVVNLLTLLLQKITNYNVVVSMYCGLAFEVLALVLILRILALTLRGSDSALFRPLALCASLIFFWPVAWENWTWGMPSIEFFGSLFWAVAVAWALTEWPGRWLGTVVASLCAILGLCTAATGFPLLAMVILGILAPRLQGGRVRWTHLGFFALLLVPLVAFYFVGYNSLGHSLGSFVGSRAVSAIAYFFTYMGSFFWTKVGGWPLAFTVGLVGVAWFLICLRVLHRRSPDLMTARELVPLALLAAYVILNGALTAFGRIDYGIAQGASSRHRSMTFPFWFAVVVVSVLLIRGALAIRLARSLRFVAAGVAFFCVAVYGLFYEQGVRTIQNRSRMLREGLASVREYQVASDEALEPLYPDPLRVRLLAKELDGYHLGPFAK